MKKTLKSLKIAAFLACAVMLAFASHATVFQKRPMSRQTFFHSLPGVKKLLDDDLIVNGTACKVSVWLMHSGLHSVWSRLNALCGSSLPPLGSADGAVLSAAPDGTSLVLLETGPLGTSIGVLLRPDARKKGEAPSREGGAMLAVWPAARRVFGSTHGRTRLEIIEVPASAPDAMQRAGAELRALGWQLTTGTADTAMQAWLRGSELYLLMASECQGSAYSRLSLLYRAGER